MNVVIVAKTRMRQNICVGAVEEFSGRFLRLIPRDGQQFHSWREFSADLGDLVSVQGHFPAKLDPPHTEDYIVSAWKPTGRRTVNLFTWISSRCTIWRGDRSFLFDGALRFTARHKGYVFRGGKMPSRSVGFWEAPTDVVLESGGKEYFIAGGFPLRMPFVGVQYASEVIPRGALLRLSLSRWWAPEGGEFPESCWLQLSGCILHNK